MYKHSPSRNQRSKGIKIKHVLQICLLLAVCFWLIYQVKHSHDKKKEFDEHDASISLNSITKNEVVKLGRKDIHPKVEETTIKNENHDEEVEEEETTSEEEEEIKHDEEEQEDNKTEEKDDDDGRGNGDEEVDDHDQEKSDEENDREEEFVDDEKEREEGDEQEIEKKDSEENNVQMENHSALQEHDRKGSATNTHEAREENYKADDASSAVTHDTQITTMDNETATLENSNGQAGVNILELPHTTNNTDESDATQNILVKVEGNTSNNGSFLAATINAESENTTSNSSVTEGTKDLLEISNNSTEVGGETHGFSLLSENGTISELNQGHTVVGGSETAKEGSNLQLSTPEDNSALLINNNQHDSNSTIDEKSKVTGPKIEDSVTLSGDTRSSILEVKSNMSAKAEDNSASSMTAKNETSEDTKDKGTGGITKALDETNSEVSDEMHHEQIDSSDSSISLEEKDIRAEIETLPDIRTVGSNSEDAAVE